MTEMELCTECGRLLPDNFNEPLMSDGDMIMGICPICIDESIPGGLRGEVARELLENYIEWLNEWGGNLP
jgi:hypothetical protein